jgi:hypothetical protein
MRKLLIAAALISSAATAAPALAQPGYGYGHGRGDWAQLRPRVDALLRDLDQVDRRIDFAVQRRMVSFREAQGLRRESNQIRFAITRQGRNGISEREFVNLRSRVDRLQIRLRVERNDRDGRRF